MQIAFVLGRTAQPAAGSMAAVGLSVEQIKAVAPEVLYLYPCYIHTDHLIIHFPRYMWLPITHRI
jgi:hypothetical protein